MPKRSTKPTVTVTAGKNEKVNNVIPFETLLERIETGARSDMRKRKSRAPGEKDDLAEIEQLARSLREKIASAKLPAKSARRSRGKDRRK